MKRLKFISILSLIWCCSISVSYAQKTSLTIDNQYPGWLSYQIPYGDQVTVQYLTVTGYLNGTDIKFLRELLFNKSLSHLDMTDANIVGDKDNVLTENMFDYYTTYGFSPKSTSIQYLALPKTVIESNEILGLTDVDTLVAGGDLKIISRNTFKNRNLGIRNVILREGTDSIAENCFYSADIKTIMLPNTMIGIGRDAFRE
jgi:hypothetical protein